MSAQNERIDQRVLNAMKHDDANNAADIAALARIELGIAEQSVGRLKRQGYIEVMFDHLHLTELAHNVCFGGE